MHKEKSSTPTDKEEKRKRRRMQFIVIILSMPVIVIFDSQIQALIDATHLSFFTLCYFFLLLPFFIHAVMKRCVKILKETFIVRK